MPPAIVGFRSQIVDLTAKIADLESQVKKRTHENSSVPLGTVVLAPKASNALFVLLLVLVLLGESAQADERYWSSQWSSSASLIGIAGV